MSEDNSGVYQGERLAGGQLVYRPDGETLDKHLDVVRIAPGGFDWGADAPAEKLLQLAVALLADRTDEETARTYHHGFAQYLADELDGEEWTLTPAAIREANWRRETSFENRADFEADPLEGGDEVGTSASQGAPTDDSSRDDPQSSATDGGTPALAEIADEIVDEAFEEYHEQEGEPVDTTLEEPPDPLVGSIRAKIGLGASRHRVNRDDLKEAVFDALQARFEDDTNTAESTSPQPSDPGQFQFLTDEQLQPT